MLTPHEEERSGLASQAKTASDSALGTHLLSSVECGNIYYEEKPLTYENSANRTSN